MVIARKGLSVCFVQQKAKFTLDRIMLVLHKYEIYR